MTDWYQRRTAPACLREVAEAVWTARRIAMRHESWTRSSAVTVDPLGLVLKAGRWYPIAGTCAGSRTYRMDKISHARMLDEVVDRPQAFDLAATWRESVARFEKSLRRESAVIRVAESCIDRLDWLGADIAERVLAAKPDGDGTRTAPVPIEGVGHTAALLLGFADEIEVLEPVALRKEIARKAACVVSMYDS